MASEALENEIYSLLFSEFRFDNTLSEEYIKKICEDLASRIVDLVEQKTLDNICSCSCGFCG